MSTSCPMIRELESFGWLLYDSDSLTQEWRMDKVVLLMFLSKEAQTTIAAQVKRHDSFATIVFV